MAGAALSIVRSTSQQLGSLLVQEAKFLYDVNEKMQILQLHLQCIQCFLEDADKNHYNSQLVRQWICQIREIAYEAEDIIDKYTVRVSCRHREEGVWNTLRWFPRVLCAGDAASLHEVGSNIDSLSRRISALTSIMQLCGLKVDFNQEYSSSAMSMQLGELRRTHSRIEDDDFIVGFQEDVRILVHHLVHADTTTTVVISGMGGLGKTTLAKKVYNDATVKQHFDGFVWVFISQNFVVRDVLELIWLKLDNNGDRRNIKCLLDTELHEKINHELQSKKYLVVLDDIWNQKSWDQLKTAFMSLPNSSSKLLLTTRDEKLLEYVDGCNGYLHHPSRLTTEESWELLQKVASRGRFDIDAEMVQMGKEMIEHCGRLPLAVAALGGILASKKTQDKWKVVKDNVHSYLSNGEGSIVLQVLELSYNELPFYLRPCFLYLANFPEDFEIRTKSLYQMWIAEGLVMPPSDDDSVVLDEVRISMEDMAERYLTELVKRCLVQVGSRRENGKIKSYKVEEISNCRLHDIMRDMCIKKAREENFLNIATQKEIWDLQSNTTFTNSATTTTIKTRRLHRLAIHLDGNGDQDSDSTPVMIPSCQYLRSLLGFYTNGCFPRNLLRALIGTCSLLRVLRLEDGRIVSLPKEVGNLIHLRFLSLSRTHVDKRSLPSSLGNLACLEMLDLRVNRRGLLIPNVLWKLRRLRYLFLPARTHSCKMFMKLEVHTLTQLETLKNLILKSCKVEGLSKLKALRKFTWRLDARDKCFKSGDKKILESLLALHVASPELFETPLSIKLKGNLLSQEYIRKLAELPGYELFINLSIEKPLIYPCLDSIETLLQQLRSLNLYETRLGSDSFPIIERLAILKQLYLCAGSFIEMRKLTFSAEGFPQLTHLTLYCFFNLEELEVEEGSMPKLEVFDVEACPKLKEIPDALERKYVHYEWIRELKNKEEKNQVAIDDEAASRASTSTS